MIRRDTIPLMGPLSWSPTHASIPSIGWWFDHLWTILPPIRAHLPQSCPRPYRTEHPCCGSHPDGLGYKVLGIPHECLGVADKSRMCRQFILHSTDGEEAGRIYRDNQAFIDGVGHCDIAKTKTRVADEFPDSVSSGLPCQPWSRGSPHKRKQHPLYHITMIQFPLYLKVRRPAQFWIENVPEIAEVKNGEASDLEIFAEECCKLGYVVRGVRIEHELFVEVPRSRTA